jgi:Glycosyl transferases group 1
MSVSPEKKKAIFLTHPHSLKSEITGGVQLCSQEFFHVLESMEDLELSTYFVPYTRKVWQRILIRLKMDNYDFFNVAKECPALIGDIRHRKIDIVFMNMATLIRFAKPLKQELGSQVKIILLSHGNDSCDFLHLISMPIRKKSFIRRWLDKIRLGKLVATESEYRVKWLDGIVSISETERQTDNWMGARKTSFLPRRLYQDFLPFSAIPGRIGFVGRLDHPPNFQGFSMLLDEISKQSNGLNIRLVGAPEKYGKIIQEKYPFVQYLGELSDQQLENELSSWSFFINPVWWYSTGSSTKLARAISWGLPIITSLAGMRGYEWNRGELLIADSPEEMARRLIEEAHSLDRINFWKDQTRLVASNGPDEQQLADRIRLAYQ